MPPEILDAHKRPARSLLGVKRLSRAIKGVKGAGIVNFNPRKHYYTKTETSACRNDIWGVQYYNANARSGYKELGFR